MDFHENKRLFFSIRKNKKKIFFNVNGLYDSRVWN
jgi:hypothetical protein